MTTITRQCAVTAAMMALVLASSNCSGDDDKPRRPGGGGTYGGGADGGGTAGSSGSAGFSGDAGTGGVAGDDASDAVAGAAGSLDDGGSDAPSACGNEIAEADEPCDGTDLHDQSCLTVGFESGALSCVNCNFDTRGCRGTERCSDGRDNDGDFRNDCADTDCAGACASSCAAPSTLSDPASAIYGVTSGHAAELEPSCAMSAPGSGPELVYRITAARTGVMEAWVTSSSRDFNLSVRRICAELGSELGCAERASGVGGVERLRVAVNAGEALFLIVDGTGTAEAGAFTLNAASRAVVCGDGNRDADEGCDDGGTESGDGCSASCQLEATESESNDSAGSADAYTTSPFIGAISPAADRDVVAVTLASGNSELTAETFDLGDGACAKRLMDTKVEILASNGVTVLAVNDDTPSSFCSAVTKRGLAAGKYLVRVSGVGGLTFPYALNVGQAP